MRQDRRWTIAKEEIEAAADLAGRLKASPILAQVLINRGLREEVACREFLSPNLKLLHEPASLPGLMQAAERIARAIVERQKIVIYGDYDVDGITATTILWHAIGRLGGVVDFYIPHRVDEGYGLKADAIEAICRDGAKVIVSVDCGITAIAPAAAARRHGVDLIITDHHEWHTAGACEAVDIAPGAVPIDRTAVERSAPGGMAAREAILPDCCAIVHPRLPGHTPAYPNPHLCGAGVAFKLAWGIGLAVSRGSKVSDDFRAFLIEATALAALGTIADVVPLIGENRVLAHFGLRGLKASKLTGILALIESANLTGQKLDSFHVGFLLAPRLNASGRMGHAQLAVEMLTTADAARAMEIAVFLESQNRARQAVEKKILDEAIAQIDAGHFADDSRCAIVLGAAGWHPGVIGIVASRIVDRYHRPAIMVGLNNGHGLGSGRSVAGFHLAHALQACGSHLETFGGHEMAAGLKVQTDKFDQFREAFLDEAGRTLDRALLVPELKIDCRADLGNVTAALVNDMTRLGPFGHANRRPLLACEGVVVATPPRRVGKTGNHLQMVVKQGERTLKCIAFDFGDQVDQLATGTRIDLAVEPCLNEYNGRTSVELQVKDMRMRAG